MKRWLLFAVMFFCMAAMAEGFESRELSGYFGQDIIKAAQELGELNYESGEEFTDNYLSESFVLRGNEGVVTLIDLKPEDARDTLCGVQNGMSRDDVIALMDGCPLLWKYDEEIAWTIRTNETDELKNEILVVFFDESGKAAGAWYRVSG